MEKHEIENVVYPGYDTGNIDGWLKKSEGETLYAISKLTAGPILEIGSWHGLSTSYIGRGVRDSRDNYPDKRFVATEMNPTKDNFRQIDDKHCGFFDPPDADKPIVVSALCALDKILPTIGKCMEILKKNMNDIEMTDYVEILEGRFEDVAPKLQYSFIFCDITHSKKGIDMRIPVIKTMLAEEGVLACHDVPSRNLVDYLHRYIHPKTYFCVDNLYVGLF